MKVELMKQEGRGGERKQPSTIWAFSYIISYKYHKILVTQVLLLIIFHFTDEKTEVQKNKLSFSRKIKLLNDMIVWPLKLPCLAVYFFTIFLLRYN